MGMAYGGLCLRAKPQRGRSPRLLRPGTRRAGTPIRDDNDQRVTALVTSELSYLRSLGPPALGEEEARATAVRESERRLVQLVRAKYLRAGEDTPGNAADGHVHAQEMEGRAPRWRFTAGKAAVFALLLLANVLFWLIIAPALGVGEGP